MMSLTPLIPLSFQERGKWKKRGFALLRHSLNNKDGQREVFTSLI